MGKTSSMWALLLLVPCILAGPILQNSCASECRSPLNPKFRYAAGQTYTYNFQATSKTWMMGTSDDQAVLEVKGQALVIFRDSCDAVLQLRQATITGLDEKVEAIELEKRPLSFSWQDGTVDSLCPDQEDPVWVVNIKRSVLSMLQHTAQFLEVPETHVIESDVIGRCPTEYTVQGTGNSIKVTKTKIPNQCSSRIDRQSSIPTVAYNVAAEIQTIPLMNSTMVCEMQIKDNVIQSTECRESHLFRPLSSEEGGARTDVTSSVSLISTTNAGVAAKLSNNRVSRTLILDPLGVQVEFQDAKDVTVVIRSICQQLAADTPPRFISQLFTELVHSLRKATVRDVKTAYNNLRGKKICPESTKTEKLFLDALPQAGNTAAISLMVDILKENKLSSRQALGWYLSLPLAKFADLDSVKAVMPLIETASTSPVALLGLTGLARRYCSENAEQCQTSTEIFQFSTKLSKILGNRCRADAKDEVKIISALKALGNLGVMAAEVRTIVADCAKDTKLPITIRLAAIQATRNNPCEKQVKDNLLNILEDKNEDAEVRIAAYQGVMRCPCSHSLLRIQTLLNAEEVNQVGSFMSSHLQNIRLNPTPGKENARRLVKKLSLDKSFPADLRKYSRNIAVTHFCNINNAGWDIDTNIVYAPKSFIPRSASMNLTLDLFGQSVNVFEIGVRAENLERLLEAYLGPDGVFDKEGVSGLLEKTSDSVSQFSESVWNRVASATRSKRANIKTNELSNLDKIVNLKEKASGIKLDAFLRVFGSEIGMVAYRGTANSQSRLDLVDNIQSRIAQAFRDLIEGAKRVEIDVARSAMFLDTAATFPTIAGFPLRLAVNGTSTIGLGLESQMDFPALFKDPLNSNIKLKLNPLAVTELSASMTIDIAVAKTGIKMAATIHSSMAADFTARLQQGSTVEVKLDLPKSKITLVDFKSAVLLVQQNTDKAERNKPVKIVNEATYARGGCSDRLSSVTGMRLCATSSVSIPRPASDSSRDTAPAFPLSGSGSFAIVLEKTEPTMKGYLLSATTTQEGPKVTSFLMTFDTPGSKTNRKVSVKGLLTSAPTLTVKVDSKAPWGNLAVEAEMVNEADIKSVLVKVLTQEKREYYGKVKVAVTREDRKYSLATSVEAGWPQQPRAVILEGGFGHEVGRSIELSLKPSGPYAKLPYAFQVTVGREFSATTQKVWLNNLEMTTPFGKVLLSTEFSRQEKNYLASFNMKYGTEQKMNAVNFNGHIQAASQPDKSVSYKTNVLYKSSRFPVMNIDLKWDVLSSPTMLNNVLVLVHGPEVDHSTNRLYINKQIQLKGFATRDFVFENKLEVTYPRYALNLKMDQAIKIDQRLVKGVLTLQIDNIKLVDGELALIIVPKDPKNLYELTAKLAYPGRTFSLVDTGKKIDSNSFSISPVLEIQPGTKIELNGKASLIKDQNGMSANMDSEVRIKGFNSPVKVSHSFQYTGDMSSMTTSNKIEWAGQPQIVLDGKLFFRTRKMPAVELAFLWNNRLDAKMETRMSRAESKMDLDINLIRLQRRVKINSQHKFMGDTSSGSLNVAWDADKDSSKQVGLDGTFTLSPSQRLVDLKATVNVENRIYSVGFNGKLGAVDFTNGDHTVRVELQLPTTKKMSLAMSLFNVNQARTMSNRLEVESQTPTGNTYQISISNAVNDLDRNLHTYNANIDVTIKGTNIEDVKMRIDSKRTIRADKRNVEFKGLVIAPKWGQNIDTSLSVEVTKDSFRVGTKYQRGPMLVTVDGAGKRTTQNGKVTVDGFVEVKAPKTSWQQSKIAMVSSYDITSILNFDISEKLSIEYKSSKSITLDTKMKLSPSTADFSVMLETPFEVARRQGVIVSGRFEPTSPRSEGSMVVMWSSPSQRQPQEARVEFDMERRPGQLRFKLTTATPIKSLESSELSFDVRSLEDSKILEIDVVVGLSEEKAKLNGRINLNPAQREVDLTVTLPNYNPLRFLVRVGSQASTYTIENRVDWGTGTFTVSGTTKYVDSGNFEVEMQIHSPELGINNFELKGVNKMQNNQRVMEFTVMRKSSTIASMKSTCNYKQDTTGVQISGTAQVSTPESPFSGSVKYLFENKKIDSGDEKGVLYKLEIDVTADEFVLNKANSHLRLTSKEKSGSVVVCTSSNQCNEGSFAFKDTGSKTLVAKELYALVKTKKNNVEETRGLRAKLSASANKFEHTTEVLFDEAKNRLVGYKVYKKDSEYGLEIYTPKRVTGAALEIVRGSGRQAFKSQFIVTVWLDKTKAPERKLVITTTAESNKMGEMEGYSTSTTIKHPMLSRELEYKFEFHKLPSIKSGRDLLHIKLDADVMDPKHQRWTFETYVKNTLADKNGRNITVDMELRSKGTDLAALLSVFGGRTAENVLLAGANLKLNEKERIEKELFVRLDASPRSAYLTLGSPAKQMTLEARMNLDDIVSYKRLQLSASTRVFGLSPTVYVLDMNTSPHVDIRVFSKGSPENYHQLVGGLLDDTRFELALIRQLNVQRKELAAAYITLNTSSLLTERLTWKLDDLRALLTTIRTRSQAIVSEVKSVRSSLAPELNTYMLKWRSFGNFKNIYDKMATDYAKQVNQLKTEVEEDESMKAIVDLMEKITWGVKKLGERIEEVLEQLGEKSEMVEAIEKAIENVIETLTERITEHMKNARKTVAQLLEELARYFEQWKIRYGQDQGIFSAIRNFYQAKSEQIREYVAKFKLSIDERLHKVISWVESLRIGDRNILAFMKEAIANANMDILRERIPSLLDETVLLPIEDFVNEIVKAYPETTRSAYRYVKVPISKIRFYLRRTSQVTRNMSQVAEASVVDKGSFWKSLIGEVIVYDVENGEISYQLPLSRKVHSLRDLLMVFDTESSPLKGLAVTSSLRSMYREMRAKYHPALASTRLNGYASLIGSKGIITFDKKSFDLSGGSCQYLLARDFLNMDFAVAINFEQPSGDRIKKSVIFTDGADQVEIKDEQVFVNSKLLAVALPAKLKLKTITVERENNIVTVRRHSGAILRCDVVKDACTFELSPFYAGRTMGLWGTFSNEHADDMSEPNGKISKDMISFVNSWKINKSCKDNVQTVTDSRHVMLQSMSSSGVDSNVCDNLFEDKDSDLSSCFKIVSPAPYHDLCLMSALKAKKSEPAFQRHLESLIAGYRVTCQRWDVTL